MVEGKKLKKIKKKKNSIIRNLNIFYNAVTIYCKQVIILEYGKKQV